MKLERLSERVWYYPFEAARDRPSLGYIRGDRWSLAVDAGHSADHTAGFYRALTDAGLPLPRLTALTHWHWDHTLGMHAVHGLTVTGSRTAAYLRDFQARIARDGTADFFALDERIRLEYAGGQPVIVTLPDMVFDGTLRLDAGNCPVRLFNAPSPHTDDSTLVFVEDEQVLFMGDAAAGAFPTWEKDPTLANALADVVEGLDARVCLESHWTPWDKRGMIDNLRSAEA